MPEWWTYSPSDFLLFSPRTYYRLFELYNLAIWPAQIPALALGVTILVSLLRGGPWRDRIIPAILASCWLWVAWAYLLQRYDTINWAAKYLAAGFALQALLLAGYGALGRLRFQPSSDAAGRLGLAILVFALIVQPLLGPLAGRSWMQAEIFGIAPDPTAIGTLGILLLADKRAVWVLFAIPLAWCAVSFATLAAMESPDAFVAPLVAAVALLATARRRRAAP